MISPANKIMYITFEDVYGEDHTIPVNIYNTDLSNRWIATIENNQQIEGKYIHSTFINRHYTDLPAIQKHLNGVANDINIEYDVFLPLFVDIDKLNTAMLNEMHRQFEVFNTRISNGSIIPTESLTNNFLLLNELIHHYEEILHNSTFPSMSTTFDYYPQTEFCPVLEQDKLHLTTQFIWGNVYLGYNTLGKDWLKVAHDNDLDVIKRNMVKPQEHFSAETWINFGPDDKEDWTRRSFSNWWYNLPKKLQNKVPIHNLNKLSLGRYSIGCVLIDDLYFLKYHPNKHDWLSYDHPIKKKWNEEVFSTFKKIVKIKIDTVNETNKNI